MLPPKIYFIFTHKLVSSLYGFDMVRKLQGSEPSYPLLSGVQMVQNPA